MARRLTRSLDGRALAPVRIVHVGLGNFFRAHQAYYTDVASDASTWGIAAFTGRTPGVTAEMQRQDGLYTLVIQGAVGNEYRVISSVVATHSGADVAQLLRYFASPDLAVVTSTVTEAGYVRHAQGGLDAADASVAADVAAVKEGRLEAVQTVPGKFVAGLIQRRSAGAGALTLCPCDNVPDNGEMVERVVREFAALTDPSLLTWMDENVSFVTTMVDRITPRPSEATFASVAADCGIEDPAAVGTEPFAQWVLSGDFKAGRPAWETAGAQFVDDIAPYEMLKLWMLNGSHSLMAYAGPILGRTTVFDAMSDPTIARWVNEWWDVAAKHLPLPAHVIADYRDALTSRFSNPNIKHLLAQIAADGSQKIPIRIVPALVAECAAGGSPVGAERAVAAWVCHVRGQGAPINDAKADEVRALGEGSLERSVEAVCDYLGIDNLTARESVLQMARGFSTLESA